MGCKQSRQVQVQPVGTKEVNKLRKCMSDNDPIEYDIDDNTNKHGRKRKSKSKKSLGSTGSLDDGRSLDSDRGGSAGSKGSKKSDDSGLDLGEENHGFITEYSDPDKVRAIEENFRARDGLGRFTPSQPVNIHYFPCREAMLCSPTWYFDCLHFSRWRFAGGPKVACWVYCILQSSRCEC